MHSKLEESDQWQAHAHV